MSNQRVHKSRALVAVAAILLSSASGCTVEPDGGSEDSQSLADALSSNEKAAYQFFVGKGLKSYQAAGIVGNLMQESGVNPTVSQFGGGPGRGIAQWSAGGRWDSDGGDNVTWYAAQHGQSRYSLNLQLEFVWYELEHFSGYGLGELKAASNVTSATIAFQDRFEGCGQCDQSTRISYAKQVLAAFGGSSSSPSLPANCDIHSDGRLYCDNKADAAMYSSDSGHGSVVNHLQSTHSWFKCWGTGALHAGGNHTWYYTEGDDNGSYGWLPGVDLSTTDKFDENPAAYGFKKCP